MSYKEGSRVPGGFERELSRMLMEEVVLIKKLFVGSTTKNIVFLAHPCCALVHRQKMYFRFFVYRGKTLQHLLLHPNFWALSWVKSMFMQIFQMKIFAHLVRSDPRFSSTFCAMFLLYPLYPISCWDIPIFSRLGEVGSKSLNLKGGSHHPLGCCLTNTKGLSWLVSSKRFPPPLILPQGILKWELKAIVGSYKV